MKWSIMIWLQYYVTILINYLYTPFFIKIEIITISYVGIFNNIIFRLGEIKPVSWKP